MTVLSLGFAFPWAMALWTRTLTNTITYAGTIDLNSLRGVQDLEASALAEGVGEAGEALGELGDFLGG